MAEEKETKDVKLGGSISLVGFGILDQSEIIVAKKIVGNYVKMMNNEGSYKEMKLTLKRHQKGNQWLHEVMGEAIFREGKFAATAGHKGTHTNAWDPYSVISEVCEKILAELKHRVKKEQRHDKNLGSEKIE